MRIEKITCAFSRYSGAAMLAAISVFTFIDVALRYLFASPITGSNEIVQLMMAGFIASSLVIATRDEKHICVSILEDHLSDSTKQVLSFISAIVSSVVFLFLTYSLTLSLISDIELGRSSDLIHIPYWLYSGVIAIFLLIATLVSLLKVYRRGTRQ